MAGISNTSGLRRVSMGELDKHRPSASDSGPPSAVISCKVTRGLGRRSLACAAARRISSGSVTEVASMRS